MSARKYHRGGRSGRLAVVAVVASLSMLGACSTLPKNSEPRALRPFSSAPQEP